MQRRRDSWGQLRSVIGDSLRWMQAAGTPRGEVTTMPTRRKRLVTTRVHCLRGGGPRTQTCPVPVSRRFRWQPNRRDAPSQRHPAYCMAQREPSVVATGSHRCGSRRNTDAGIRRRGAASSHRRAEEPTSVQGCEQKHFCSRDPGKPCGGTAPRGSRKHMRITGAPRSDFHAPHAKTPP
jgi:hypothetical protein